MTWTLRAASITLAAWLATAASPCAGTRSAPSQASPESARVRMALVGAWHVHTGGFLNRISQMNAGQVEWVAVWDRDAVRGKQFADRLGVPYEPEYQRILDNPAVDAVMIEAETNLHADLIIRAARARKHVFTDKILTPRVEDALRIKEAIERSGVKFVISHESMPVGSYQFAPEAGARRQPRRHRVHPLPSRSRHGEGERPAGELVGPRGGGRWRAHRPRRARHGAAHLPGRRARRA